MRICSQNTPSTPTVSGEIWNPHCWCSELTRFTCAQILGTPDRIRGWKQSQCWNWETYPKGEDVCFVSIPLTQNELRCLKISILSVPNLTRHSCSDLFHKPRQKRGSCRIALGLTYAGRSMMRWIRWERERERNWNGLIPSKPSAAFGSLHHACSRICQQKYFLAMLTWNGAQIKLQRAYCVCKTSWWRIREALQIIVGMWPGLEAFCFW